MNERKGLEGLLAWQKSMEFAKRIYTDVIPLLPKEEKWVIGSQLRHAASIVPANMAEGYGRFYFQEGVRFSYIARGSLEEILTFLTLAKDLNYLPVELFEILTSRSIRNKTNYWRLHRFFKEKQTWPVRTRGRNWHWRKSRCVPDYYR